MIGLSTKPAAAAITAVKGSACSYSTNVSLFGGAPGLLGCGEAGRGPAANNPPDGPLAPGWDDTSYSPQVALPADGSGGSMTATDPNGAKATYGPATIHGGRWPENVNSAQPSGPQAASTTGSPASGTVTSTADISLHPTPISVTCYTGYSPPCLAPGGFGPFPVEGDSLHAECTANASGVTGSATFSNAELTTSTTGDGTPVDQEPVPNNPPVNYTRHGVITNVGDVFTVVYNQQIRHADGSLTVNAVHIYLFGPTAVGEVIRGQVTCGTTPASSSPPDTLAPSCSPVVVRPVSNTDPVPSSPRKELIGVFDAGRGPSGTGLQSITNIQVQNGTVQVGDPASTVPYLKFTAGMTGPLAVTATRTAEAEAANQPLIWSFDATDAAGNTTHCENDGQAFHPLTPARILDSRAPVQVGPYDTPWSPGQTRNVTVTGGGTPAGAGAVVLNVAVTGTTTAGYLTIWPAGQPQPLAASLNWAPGQTIPNAVTVKVGTAGAISIFNSSGSTHVVVDRVGYYDRTLGDGFTSLTPSRILDSRAGAQVGPYNTPWGGGQTRDVTVTGGDTPAGADAVVLNVAVTGTTAAGYLTIWPAGQPQPLAASLNWAPGQTIPNAVTVKVGTGGAISIFNSSGDTHVVIDRVGYFAAGVGQLFHPVNPARILDSRAAAQVGPYNTPWGPGVARDVQVGGQGGVPAGIASAALLNMAVTGTTAASWLTVWPAGQPAPLASSLNWAPGDTISNAVTARIGTNWKISAQNAAGNVDVIVDTNGWYG